jgi:cytochrome P450
VKPRGPANPPILGHTIAFRRNPLQFLSKLAAEYGDLVYYRIATMPAFYFGHPDFVKDILVTRQSKFRKSRMLQRARILLGDGLLTSEGQYHLQQRRLVQPAFHRDRLAAYGRVMTECAVRTRERWQAGSTLEMSEEMMRLTLAIVGRTLFSADVESEASEIREALTTILKMFNFLVLPFSQYLEKLPLPIIRRFERAKDRLDATIYRMIRERRASGSDQGDLLSMLLLARDEDTGLGMSDEQVRDEALTLFLAGHETTANALTWTWYLLSQHPECEAKLHREIDSVLEGRPPSVEDLPHLRYTEMVLAESIRLYPPAWAVGRTPVEAIEIAGVAVPVGALCIMSPYLMHRDSRFYPEPLRFDPERWTPEKKEARPKFSYFPFGGGARICIGERFAWMEGTLALAAIAQRWKLRLAPGHRVDTLPLLTLRPRYGMNMLAVPRESACFSTPV